MHVCHLLTQSIQKNFNEENVGTANSNFTRKVLIHDLQGVVTFTLEELKGVPADVISGYKKRTEDSKDLYDVTFKTPDIFPVVLPLISLFLDCLPDAWLVQICAEPSNPSTCS